MQHDIATLRARLDRLEAIEGMNFPPKSGQDFRFRGRDEIATPCAGVSMGATGHCAANVGVQVDEAARGAERSAYFLANPLAEGSLRGGRPAVVGARSPRA